MNSPKSTLLRSWTWLCWVSFTHLAATARRDILPPECLKRRLRLLSDLFPQAPELLHLLVHHLHHSLLFVLQVRLLGACAYACCTSRRRLAAPITPLLRWWRWLVYSSS